jgi:hypothetical protein
MASCAGVTWRAVAEFLFHLYSLECHSRDWLALRFYVLAIIWLEKHSIISLLLLLND